MTRVQARMLPDGRRLHLNDGPIDLIISAEGAPHEVGRAYAAAHARFATVLDELTSELALLRRPVGEQPKGAVAQRMWAATEPLGRHAFITPMAAVAGSVAEEMLHAMLQAAPLTRAFVNNGGDIALHLAQGQHYDVGLVDRPDRPSLFSTARITPEDHVHGIATSGWRGRSFSLGIADAVTVLAERASRADAAATLIANAVNLPAHPAVTRVPAADLQPDSDLGDTPVTRAVGPLQGNEIAAALDAGVAFAKTLLGERRITAVALHLAGQTRTLGRIDAGSQSQEIPRLRRGDPS